MRDGERSGRRGEKWETEREVGDGERSERRKEAARKVTDAERSEKQIEK